MRNAERGQAALELLLGLLVLAVFLFGLLDIARARALWESLDSRTFAATLALALQPDEWAWATGQIEEAVADSPLGSGAASGLTVRVFTLEPDGGALEIDAADLQGLGFRCPFELVATVNYQSVIPFLPERTLLLRSRHIGVIQRYSPEACDA